MIYLDDYFFYDPALIGDRPTMVEIGVFTVEKAERFAAAHPGAVVHLVEPDPVNFQALARRAAGRTFLCWNLALSAVNGAMPFYRYGHEQWHSGFARHEREGMKLVETVTATGRTLKLMLNILGVSRCDLLLLNCEGGEIAALEQLAADEALRARVPQICTSFHCDHIHIYPPAVRDDLLRRLGQWYDIRVGTFRAIPYYLFQQVNR